MYMDLTRTVCKWVSLPEGHQNEVTARETVVFLQRLASLERNGNISARISADWQELYLKTLYALCTNSAQTEKARELRKDAFNKVEAYCLIGLRARSIAWRHKFFRLHCKYIGRTPYERLYYIFHTQDWKALSNTFWLNICVSLILDIVDGKPYPNLAPNSSQLPSLLPERKKAASAEGEKSGPGTEQKAAEAAQGGEKPAAQAEKEGAPAAPAQQSGEPVAAPPQGSGAEKPASGDQPASAAEGGEAAKEKEAAATAVKQDGETPEAAPAEKPPEETPSKDEGAKASADKPEAEAQKAQEEAAAAQKDDKADGASGKETTTSAAMDVDSPQKAEADKDGSNAKEKAPEAADQAAAAPESKESEKTAMDVDAAGTQSEKASTPAIKIEEDGNAAASKAVADAAVDPTASKSATELQVKPESGPAQAAVTKADQGGKLVEVAAGSAGPGVVEKERKKLKFDVESDQISDIFERHASFLSSVAQVRMENVIFPLQEVRQRNPQFIFPAKQTKLPSVPTTDIIFTLSFLRSPSSWRTTIQTSASTCGFCSSPLLGPL